MAVIKRLSSYGKNVVAAPRASENPGVSPILVKVDGNVVSDTGLLGGRYYVTLNHFGRFSTFTRESCPAYCEHHWTAKGCQISDYVIFYGFDDPLFHKRSFFRNRARDSERLLR